MVIGHSNMFVSFLVKISLQFIPYLPEKGGWVSHDQTVLGGFAVTSLPVRVHSGWSLGSGVLEPLLMGVRGHWMPSQRYQEKKIMASPSCDKHGRKRPHLLPSNTISYLLPRSSHHSSSFLTGRLDTRDQFFWMSACHLCRRDVPTLIYLILKFI